MSKDFEDYIQDRLRDAGLKRDGEGGYVRIEPERELPPTRQLKKRPQSKCVRN